MTDQDLLCMKLQLEKVACQQKTGYPDRPLGYAEIMEQYNIEDQSATLGNVLTHSSSLAVMFGPLLFTLLPMLAVFLFNRGKKK